ncbi:hypothetical protein ACFE04_026817 [Oxalis oulophora]
MKTIIFDENPESEMQRLEGDSNALILPGKKIRGKKGAREEMTKKAPPLSKSQKRKLRKLEEAKEKELLLKESLENLEKYKISEDAYSLLRSAKSIGQAETRLEKRRKVMLFSKVGLELTEDRRPVKETRSEDDDFEPEIDLVQSNESQDMEDHDDVQPTEVEREVLNKTNSSISMGSPQESSIVNGPSLECSPFVNLPAEDISNLNSSKTEVEDFDYRNEIVTIPEERKSIEETNPPSVPTVVHVSRPADVENQRKDLPIVMMEQEIMEAINYQHTVIICGETGCGKTTQVPQFLYEAGYGSKQSNVTSGIIGVTQPRRVAVLATAKRIAHELGLRVGKEVGFQVRHDKRIGADCSIKVMTDGILLREVQTDFSLKRYSAIVIDEAHERSLNTDILIGMLSRIVQLRQDLYKNQREALLSGHSISRESMIFPLKLVIMSATLRVEDFVSGRRLFRNPPPVVEVAARQYPVTKYFSKRTEIIDYIGQAYKKVMSIHKKLPHGGILVFVTGQKEVKDLCHRLSKASRELIAAGKSRLHHEATSNSGTNIIEGLDDKEIDEAFEIHGHSTSEHTDRFSSFDDEDQCDFDDEKSDSSYGSESESDFEILGDDGDLLENKSLENDSDAVGLLGEEGSLASLKAAFEALSGKVEPPAISDVKKITSVNPEGHSTILSSKIEGKKDVGEKSQAGPMRVLPLYAMLDPREQLRVFDKVKEGERLVVVATNVAETSLTIPGIKYVVDTGREKVKNYNLSNGMETFEIQWISKASASQRAGRAGRTGPGHCYRLYSSAVFNNIFQDFASPEISKTPVDWVILVMKAMHIDKVDNFPFPTPPEASAIKEAERCLKALEALDGNGRLTPLGEAMARYPLSPRHSRMLLTVLQSMQNVPGHVRQTTLLGVSVAAAAALSMENPFVRFEGSQADKVEKKEIRKLIKEKMESRAKFLNPKSDAFTIAFALKSFELSKNPVKFCEENGLHLKTMEEMAKLRKQLLKLVFDNNNFEKDYQKVVEQNWNDSHRESLLSVEEEEILGKAICSGWADRVAKRITNTSGLPDQDRNVRQVRYQASMVKEIVYLHRRSSISNSSPEFLVYSELLSMKVRPYMIGATSVKPEWLVKYAKSLCTFSAIDREPCYDRQSDQVLCWVTPTFGPHLWQLQTHKLPIDDDVKRVTAFAYVLLEGEVLPCIKSFRKDMAARPCDILKPEAAGKKRVGRLLFMLKTKSIDSCARLREAWEENPKLLYLEILDWFQKSFWNQFDELWSKMLHEASLEDHERFLEKARNDKNKKSKMNI